MGSKENDKSRIYEMPSDTENTETIEDLSNVGAEGPELESSKPKGSQSDPGGVIEDPVRMYLWEAGQAPLLTAMDEKRLAQKMDRKRRIDQIRNSWHDMCGKDPSALDVLLDMLGELREASPIIDAARPEVGLSRVLTLSQTLYHPKFRYAVDGGINRGLVRAIAETRDTVPEGVEATLINVSIDSSIIPPSIIQHLENRNFLAGINGNGFLLREAAAAHGEEFGSHLNKVQAEGEKARQRLI